jgi:DNA polymerase-1
MGIKYLTEDLSKLWAIDIEGDLIPSTVIWCLCAVKFDTKEEVRLRNPNDIKEWVNARLLEGHRFVGHNILGYDAPTLNRLLGTRIRVVDVIDTFVLSMVYSPSLYGGHSLGDWGLRLKHPKGDWFDFSKWSKEQEDYCLNDAILCMKVYIALLHRCFKAEMSEEGIEIEHRSWALIQQQKKNGFAFNYPEAMALYAKVRGIENDIARRVHEIWPAKLTFIRKYAKAYKKDGSYTKDYLRHIEQYPQVTTSNDGGYLVYDYVSFNIGSPDQRLEKLLALGWVHGKDEVTKTGRPQPVVKGRLAPSLEHFVNTTDNPGVKLIAEWLDYNARGNMINTWMEAYNHDTRCIHGSLWLANTLRYKHSSPNTANIPAVRVTKDGQPLFGKDGVFTYEARNLWTTRDSSSRRLVGVDAKGIQLRVLAHYLNNKEFTDAVLGGDPHSFNQKVGGFASRAVAKTFIYAFLLGAGDAKVGQIINDSARAGKEVKGRFVNNFAGLGRLLNDLERQVDRTGRIILCDGTTVIVDRPHTRLGYLLQGDESRIMKKAKIFLAQMISKQNLDALQVGDIHDEWQYDVHNDHVDAFITACVVAFRRSGEWFNYRLPIECDAKVGLTWAETH